MKKLMIILVLAIPLNLAHGRPFVSAGMGVLRPNEELRGGNVQEGTIGLESRHYGLSFTLLHYEQDNKLHNLFEGSVMLMPLMFNGYVRGRVTKNLGVHAGGGFSYVLVDHTLVDSISEAADSKAAKIKEDMKNGLGSQAMGGLEYRVTKHIYLGADIIYLFFHTDIHRTVTIPDKYGIATENSTIQRLELDSLIYSFNLKYKF